MRNHSFQIAVIFLIFISLISVFFAASGQAGPLEDLQKQIQDRQAQIKQLEERVANLRDAIKNNQGQQSTLKKQITLLDSQINQLEFEIKLTRAKISEACLEIESLNNEIQNKESEIDANRNYLVNAVRAINEYDQKAPLEIVLENDNFSDLFNQLEYTENLQESVQEKLNNLKTLKTQLSAAAERQNTYKNNLESLDEQLTGKNLALNSQEANKQNLLITTKNQEKKYQSLVQDLQARRQEIEKEIYLLEDKLRMTIDPNSVPPARKGLLAWPLIDTISQGYGCVENTFAIRTYPSCNSGRGGFHNGIDISSSLGQPIRAPDDGIVSGEGNNGQYVYGKWLTINHQNGLTTLYGHLSAFKVGVGQKISRGEIIGYAGNTGNSTGPHLHFTVYATDTFHIESRWYGLLPIGGSINPLNYLD
ncbi:MAG: peptidoglycan DD-metalloendopeptidase family protein [Candidatus Portnoybacteria bacterium]|nr:peptidoglycan DD-metalloendopeptidase family protein [Candidatus Portnoybacteria bacterium]